jgi:phosphatidylglycerophosphate synthase
MQPSKKSSILGGFLNAAADKVSRAWIIAASGALFLTMCDLPLVGAVITRAHASSITMGL